MVATGVGFFVYAPWLVAFFGDDPVDDPRFLLMHGYGVEYLRITVFAYAGAGVAITLAQALNGAGSTKTPLLLDSIVLVLQLPIAAYICLRHEEMGYDRRTLWWSLVLTALIAAAFYAYVWERGHWKSKRIQ
jgi:Na+-driven multidrug efflux pump